MQLLKYNSKQPLQQERVLNFPRHLAAIPCTGYARLPSSFEGVESQHGAGGDSPSRRYNLAIFERLYHLLPYRR
jgi:hypothetical protein